MKKTTFIVFLLMSAISISAQSLELTLSKAIEIALAENPTIKVADKDIRLKEIADKEAWQALLPTLDLNGTLSHTLLVPQVRMGNQTFPMGNDGTTTATGLLTLALPVFAPDVYQNMKITKQDILLAQEKARASRLDLINQVRKAYYSVLLSQDSYNVMKKSYQVSKDNFEVVNNKFNVGKVNEYDKISAEVQMRGMNSAMVSSATGLNLSMLQLKVLMGITAPVELVVNDSLEAYEKEITLENTTALSSELENNSSLRQIDYNMEILQRTDKKLRTSFMPTVALSLTGQYQSISNNDWNVFNYRYSPSSTFAVNISVPIFRMSNWTRLQSNKVKMEQLSYSRQSTSQQLTMAVESYQKNMLSTLAKMESDREAVKQASKAVTISAKRYDVGRGTILELNQSEISLTEAQLTYNQSLFDYLKNKADLDYTLGRE